MYNDFLTLHVLFSYSGTFGQAVLWPSLPDRAIKKRENCRSLVLRIKAAVSYLYSEIWTECTRYLQEVVDQKDLGITFSNNLTLTRHVQDVVKKAHQKIAMFRRSFSGFDATNVKILYQSLIRPALEYASTAWNPNLKKDNSCTREGASQMFTPQLEWQSGDGIIRNQKNQDRPCRHL